VRNQIKIGVVRRTYLIIAANGRAFEVNLRPAIGFGFASQVDDDKTGEGR
jgi:hypothetical protein